MAPPISGQATAKDDDMDLVKSLLADLMDEPEDKQEAGTEAVDTEHQIPEVMENPFFEEDFQEGQDDEKPVALESVDLEESGAQEESELARLARELEADQPVITDEAVQEDQTDEDLEEMLAQPRQDLISRLSLVGTVAAVGASAELIAAPKASEEAQHADEVQAEVNEREMPRTAPPHPVIDDTDDIAPLLEDIQEEDHMPRAHKTITRDEDTLLGEDVAEETENAFASLSQAVQEKELAEENGPPIGELVKEALRPMLQEWLDKNLKGMVQRAITKEIKRISSGK